MVTNNYNNMITPQEASKRAEVDVSTIHRWCKEFDIGIKCGGRWKVDTDKLDLVLSGVIHSPIVRGKNNSKKDE